MKCSLVQQLFTEFDDGSLRAEIRPEFDNHIALCQECARALKDFQWTLRELHALGFVKPPPDLLPGIHAKLDKSSLLDRLLERWKDLDFSVSLPAAVATIAIAMIAGFFVKNSPLMEQYLLDRQPVEQTRPLPPGQGAPGSVNRLASQPRAESPGLPALPAHRGLQSAGYQPQAPAPSIMASPHHAPLLALDMIVTDRTASPEQQNILFRDLLTAGAWQTQRLPSGILLIRLSPPQLPLLQEVLARHQVTITPSPEASTHLLHKNAMLNVAVRLK